MKYHRKQKEIFLGKKKAEKCLNILISVLTSNSSSGLCFVYKQSSMNDKNSIKYNVYTCPTLTVVASTSFDTKNKS